MRLSLIVLFLISTGAYSIDDCNFKKTTKEKDIERLSPKLSEAEVISVANKFINQNKIVIADDWCRDVSLDGEYEKIKWDVFYTGEELDHCFSIIINDRTRKASLEYCS